MPITIGFFSWERINHFPFISYGKYSFGIRLVWYKSKDLERIKDVHGRTNVLHFLFLDYEAYNRYHFRLQSNINCYNIKVYALIVLSVL
jgi:hypothetical protein